MNHPPLAPVVSVADFDALHDDPAAWRGVIESLAAEHGGGPVMQMSEGTVLVALIGAQRVIKLYPPFLRDPFAFERAALARLGGRLCVPTPQLVATGARDGWPYLVMTQLSGEPLTAVWPTLAEAAKCALLASLGTLAAEVHALPVGELAALAPRWDDFVIAQRSRCQARQQRTGLPAHLLAQLDPFLQGPLPQGPDVILTGEYTPMNLLARDGRLCGMYDFGDGMVGPREYDLLGPLCFLGAGHASRCRAFLDGYGGDLDTSHREGWLRLLLLHRYSNLPAQIAYPGWQDARSFEDLARRIWP